MILTLRVSTDTNDPNHVSFIDRKMREEKKREG
jgi:hypothetical protein